MHEVTPRFRRTLSYKRIRAMNGRDVLAVERALHMHGWRWPEPTMVYDWRARDEVKLFQRVQGLTADGVYGESTHKKLVRYFDDYGRWLYNHSGQTMHPEVGTVQDKLMHSLWGMYALRPWQYHAVRPVIYYPYGQHIGYTFDCSWFVKQVFFRAGLPAPDGLSYSSGNGNTETLRVDGTEVHTIVPGDLLFYGRWGSASDPAHVAMASGNDKCIGFGSTGGPWLEPFDYRPIQQVRRYIKV